MFSSVESVYASEFWLYRLVAPVRICVVVTFSDLIFELDVVDSILFGDKESTKISRLHAHIDWFEEKFDFEN
jgi:hypothetical protein